MEADISDRQLTSAPRDRPSSAFAGLAGVARRDVTPPVGIAMGNWGAAPDAVAEGIHRPLTATALALRAEREPLAVLVAIDLCWFGSAEYERRLRAAVAAASGVADAALLLCLSHTHSAPSVTAEEAGPGGELVAPYLERVEAAVVEAVAEAVDGLRPATLVWGSGSCALAANRDLPLEEGVACGYNPAEPADGDVVVGRVTGPGGEVIATVVNYACHPTTLGWDNRHVSPDYVGAMRELVEEGTDGAPCLFVQGASGELAPREQYLGDTSVADRHGRQLGHAVLGVLEAMLPPRTVLTFAGTVESGAALALWERTSAEPPSTLRARRIDVELTLRGRRSRADLERRWALQPAEVAAVRIERALHAQEEFGDARTAIVPCWLWLVGDAIVVAQPGEAYSLLQHELRRRFPGRTVVVANKTNGWNPYYLAPAESYDRDDVYQVWQSALDRGSLERLIDACAQAVAELEGAAR